LLQLPRSDEQDPLLPASPIRLRFEQPIGTVLATHQVQFLENRTNLMPQTLLRGFIVRANGEGVRDAKVTVPPFPGETKSAPDGSWAFALGIDQPLSGNVNVTIQVEVTGQNPVQTPAVITRGQTNQISITV
jgi:hypothetical protein